MYDLMGKAVGQPCHTLFGPQCRGYVPVSSWFNATSPARMAEAVQHYAAMGHTYRRIPCSPLLRFSRLPPWIVLLLPDPCSSWQHRQKLQKPP